MSAVVVTGRDVTLGFQVTGELVRTFKARSHEQEIAVVQAGERLAHLECWNEVAR